MDSSFYDDGNISQILYDFLRNNENISSEELMQHAQYLFGLKKLKNKISFEKELSTYTEFRLHKALLLYFPPVLLVLGIKTYYVMWANIFVMEAGNSAGIVPIDHASIISFISYCVSKTIFIFN
jgi:hypothetical protein